jgi:hypothetical protein
MDPLRSLAQPNPATLPKQQGGGQTITSTTTLNAGVYQGGISIAGKAVVTMTPGIYYMQGGGFSVTGQATVTGNGVMIFNDNGGGSIKIAGQGAVTLSPPTSGIYQGITLFQDRTSNAEVSVTGNGSTKITGTFYAASALLKVAGNGSSDVIGNQYISYDLQVAGNGSVVMSYDANSGPKTRLIGLVE